MSWRVGKHHMFWTLYATPSKKKIFIKVTPASTPRRSEGGWKNEVLCANLDILYTFRQKIYF